MSRKTILHLVNILGIGGAEGQFVERLRWLDARRHRSLVATLRRVGPNLATLTALGMEPKEFPLGPTLAHPRTAQVIGSIAALARRERVDLIHSQDFYTNLLAAPAAALCGAKLIVSRLDLAHWHGPRRRHALAWATRAADRVWANAWAIEHQLVREEGTAPSRIAVIENGIDLRRFDERAARGLEAPLPTEPGARLLVIVANLHPVKGQEDAIDALAFVASRHPDVHLVLVGEGDRREHLLARARARRLERRVHLLGHRMDVPAILARAELLISSSHAEGLSNSVIEGMAAGLPVIATAVGGNPELVQEGETGFVVPPHAPAALGERLERLLVDPGMGTRLGEAGRAAVEARFPIERMARRFEALYDEVLEDRPSPWVRTVRTLQPLVGAALR
jgi:glycosyltransferase involved in cell wall biosynthesis